MEYSRFLKSNYYLEPEEIFISGIASIVYEKDVMLKRERGFL